MGSRIPLSLVIIPLPSGKYGWAYRYIFGDRLYMSSGEKTYATYEEASDAASEWLMSDSATL